MKAIYKVMHYFGLSLIYLGIFVIISSFYNTIKWLWLYGLLIEFIAIITLVIYPKKSYSTNEKGEKNNGEVAD
jgi:putative effector of murein hydrolase